MSIQWSVQRVLRLYSDIAKQIAKDPLHSEHSARITVREVEDRDAFVIAATMADGSRFAVETDGTADEEARTRALDELWAKILGHERAPE